MHRSGTSAVTRVLNLLGADLPTRLMSAVPGDNDLGFWESIDIVDLHDDFLAAAQSCWDDLAPIDTARFQSEIAVQTRDRIVEILERDFAESQLFVIKDPRICRLVPLWLTILRQFGAQPLFVIPARNPLEVAASLQKRNEFSTEKSLLLWLWHVLEVERATRRSLRTFVSYADLLHDWRSAIRIIETDLGVTLSSPTKQAVEGIEGFLSERYRRHRFRSEDLESRPEVTDWVSRTFNALRDQRDNPGLCTRILNQVRRELLAAHSTYAPLLSDAHANLADARTDLRRLEAVVGFRDQELAEAHTFGSELSGQLKERSAELERLTEAVQERDRKLAEASEKAGQLSSQLVERQAELEQFEATMELRVAEVMAAREESKLIRAERQKHEAQIERLNTALRERDTELTEGHSETTLLSKRLAKRQDELDRLNATLRERDAELAEAREESASLRGKLEKNDAVLGQLDIELRARDTKLKEAYTEATFLRGGLEKLESELVRLYTALRRGDAELAEARTEIARLGEGLEARQTEGERLATALRERDASLAHTSNQVNVLTTRFEAQRVDLSRVSEDLARLESLRSRQSDQIEQLVSSKSWRLTKPMRVLVAALRRTYGALTIRTGPSPKRRLLESGLFDSGHYQRLLLDSGTATDRPLEHYLAEAALALSPHPLFDASFYLQQHPEVAEKDLNPLMHFLEIGRENSPHPLFDSAFYLEQLAATGRVPETNLLTDYLEQGVAEGLDPHPLFDTSYYLEANPRLRKSGENPLVHFVRTGAAELRNPHPLFDTRYYAEEACPHVLEHGSNPLVHFLSFGAAEGRSPHPLFDTSFYLHRHPEVAEKALNPLLHFLETGSETSPHPLFDAAYYLEQLAATDREPESSLLADYLEHGVAEDLDPHPLFDTSYYLETTPQLRETGENPLAHYMRTGAVEGRNPHLLFDTAHYAQFSCPGVFEHGFNPLVHFAFFGAAEGRNPHPMFDGSFYLQEHPEVKAQNLNPLLHFLEHGGATGLKTHPAYELDFFVESSKPSEWRRRTEAHSLRSIVRAKGIAFDEIRSPLVSAVIAVHNQIGFTLQCLHSLATGHGDIDLEVIVVDDGSSDATAEVLASVPNLRVVRHDSAKGFIDAANSGAAAARGEYLLFLNNDTVVPTGSIDGLLATFKEFPDAGAVGAKLLFGDGSLQEAGAIVWRDGSAWNFGRHQNPAEPQYNYARRVDYCSASCLMIGRRLFLEIGSFDRHFRPMYYEDTDLAFRVREAGKEVYYQPTAEVFHFEGATAGTDVASGMKSWQVDNQHKLVDRWRKQLASLPASGHQPNVSKDRGVTKRALIIDHRLPAPDQDAGSVRMYQITRIFRELGFKVTFIPHNLQKTEPYCRNLQAEGVEVLCAPFLTSIREHLEGSGELYDVVLLSRVNVAHDLLQAVRTSCPEALAVFDTVDLHYLRMTREAEHWDDPKIHKQARLIKYLELAVATRADSTLVVSKAERDLLLKEDANLQVDLLPLIHSPVDRVIPFSNRKNFYFIGGFEHPPNVDAVFWLVGEILPLIRKEIPAIHLFIVGSKVPPSIQQLASQHVTVTGYVEDLTPFLDGCRLSVAPIRFGAGIKGKVTQSLAHGVPCVLTSIAAEGIGLTNGKTAVIADTKEDLARGVVRVYQDEKLWTQLSAAGRDTIRKSFSVEAARRHLKKVIGRAEGVGERARHPRKSLQRV